jgi:tRNA U34 5-methylaminomethyl-2-thiouridine-forming methyltransferase MnmC
MPVFLTEDGSHSFLSEQFDVLYHSSHGAIQETQHIYIDAGLKHVASQTAEIVVLDMGFGTGLNAFMTYWEAQRLGLKIRYITYEKYPLSKKAVSMLNFDAQLNVPKHILETMHDCSWDKIHELSENFKFEKRLADFEDIDLQNEINLIYYDAFAPEIQPQLWEQPMMQKMYDALVTKGILTTYCAKGIFKRTLKSIGFHVEGLAGPPFKREITRALKE